MGRWEPDAAGRFRAAALELFGQIGYEQATVSAIAARAGLTARTFFRHFADKREVLFTGAERLQQLMVEALEQAPPDAVAMDAVALAVRATSDFFDDERRSSARLRQAVIAAHPDLHERELIKMATLSEALAAALRGRGVGEPDASLAASLGLAVFRVAFAQWVGDAETRSHAEIVDASLARMVALTAR